MNAVMVALLPLVDKVPRDEDVKAGWVAFALFILLAVAVILIGWALTRSLKKSNATAELGGYDLSDRKRGPRR